jgi:trans-aconitate methyltransferase
MQRLPEPELMDDALQARAYAAADFSATDQALVDAVLERLAAVSPQDPGPPERMVDLGCGPGNISFRLAQACPKATVLGLDGAAAMLELADQRRQSNPGPWTGLRFQLACLPLAPGAIEHLPGAWRPPFTTLVSNSLLHHLHDPQVLWRSLRQLGAPGALVVVRDLRRPVDQETLEALVEHHAAGAPAVLRRDYALSLRAAFRADEVADQLLAAGLQELTVRELGDRHFEVIGRLA